MQPPPDITLLLTEWTKGNREALNRLTPFVYQELRKLAGSYMRLENPGHTLQSTALVHEVYLKLVDQRKVNWQSRAHFFGVAAKLMRRILVDHAKAGRAAKRGGEACRTLLEENSALVVPDTEILVLDEALNKLESIDPRKSKVVELRFFGGMTTEETAQFLTVSVATIERDWTMAKAWLFREMQGGVRPSRTV